MSMEIARVDVLTGWREFKWPYGGRLLEGKGKSALKGGETSTERGSASKPSI